MESVLVIGASRAALTMNLLPVFGALVGVAVFADERLLCVGRAGVGRGGDWAFGMGRHASGIQAGGVIECAPFRKSINSRGIYGRSQ